MSRRLSQASTHPQPVFRSFLSSSKARFACSMPPSFCTNFTAASICSSDDFRFAVCSVISPSCRWNSLLFTNRQTTGAASTVKSTCLVKIRTGTPNCSRAMSPEQNRRSGFVTSVDSRVERWRGGLGGAYLFPTLSVAGASVSPPCSVSTSRSSNRACGFPAHGSPTGFARQHTMARSRLGRDSDDFTTFADKQSSFRDRLVLNGVNRQSQSPDCWSLPVTCQKSGSFPPPALPGFISSTGLSATPDDPACPSRESS